MTLNQRIASFYDASSPLWLNVWGDQMHHGYYGPHGKESKNRRTAQLDLIDELIAFAQLDRRFPRRILDAGCGVGGSARYLAGYFDAEVLGLTLSSYQAARGNSYARAEGADSLVEIRAQDIYQLEDDEGFDVIWSLESAEHMPDKEALLDHFYDLLRPGGTLAMVTWCHRETPPALSQREVRQLDKICQLYHLPAWVAPSTYAHIATRIGYSDIRTNDWSRAVAPFWGEVIKSALSLESFIGLLSSGADTIRGAWAMQYMQAGFRSGLIKYAVITARKPYAR